LKQVFVKILSPRSVSLKLVAVVALSALLAACGGGSSTSSSASASAVSATVSVPIGQQSADALVKNAVDTGNSAVQLSSATGSFAGAGSDISVKSVSEKSMSQAVDCTSSAQLRSLCVGQMSVDTSLSAVGTGIPAGSYINIGFTGFRTLSASADQATTGSVSMSFQDAFASRSLFNGTVVMKVNMTSPLPEIHTDLTLNFKQMSVSGTGTNLTMNGGATVTQTGQAAVDVMFTGWRTLSNTPQTGSQAVISSGQDSAKIQVVGQVGTQTTYDVTVSSNGAAKPLKRVVQDLLNGLPSYKILY
jgi:hypothetical protein